MLTLIAEQNSDAPQPAILVALYAPMIQTTEITAKKKGRVNGLPKNLVFVARINHRLTLVPRPAIQIVPERMTLVTVLQLDTCWFRKKKTKKYERKKRKNCRSWCS